MRTKITAEENTHFEYHNFTISKFIYFETTLMCCIAKIIKLEFNEFTNKFNFPLLLCERITDVIKKM